MLIMLALAVQATPAPGPVKVFGDWAVACDNTRLCEATSLPIPAKDTDVEVTSMLMSIVRGAGSDGELRIQAESEGTAPVALQIDGREVAAANSSGPEVIFTGAAAEQAVRAMTNGASATLVTGGRTLGKVSLAGVAATLRFIDAQQGRAGTVTALVARGNRPSSAVPTPPAAPRIGQVRWSGTAATLTPALARSLVQISKCDAEIDPANQPIKTLAIGEGKTLVLIPCGAGAYNFSSVPLIIASGRAALARFDSPPGFTKAGDAIATLVNAGWDGKTGELSSYSKGRGIGDCGSAERYVFDGTRFRMVESRQMSECRGSTNWLRTWVATPTVR